MSEPTHETELAATVQMSGPSPARRSASSSTASSSTASATATSQRSLPPGALRSDHVDVSGAPRRDPRRLLVALGGILALVALGLVLRPWLAPAPAVRETVAVLEITQGTVEIMAAGGGQVQSRLLSLAGTEIPAGTVIETRPDAGRAALRLAGGASLRLDVDTRVRMLSESALALERGAVYVDSEGAAGRADADGDGGGSSVEVRTTLGVVRDVGTQFEVRLLPAGTAETSLRVRVREGAVQWQRDGVSHAAGAGEELAVREDGTVRRGTVPVYGAHWDWVLETAPLPAIDGLPLRAFLDWYAREGGWTLRFAEPALAERAASTVLHGTADGLSPDEAASMALRGSGLQSRLEEGVLWVETAL